MFEERNFDSFLLSSCKMLEFRVMSFLAVFFSKHTVPPEKKDIDIT